MLLCARLAVAVLLLAGIPRVAFAQLDKLDPLTQSRLSNPFGQSRVILRAVDGTSPSSLVSTVVGAGGTVRTTLSIVNALAVDLPNSSLLSVAANPLVARLSLDRPIAGSSERTGATVGATAVRQAGGYDGAGVGVAIVDSGITSWHDDLAGPGAPQRVHRFVDFVNGRATPYDDYGHGTHVAGIVAGNGFDSGGARTGIAPGAHLIVLKVLDASGRGHISNVIAALDDVVANKHTFNIRVVNLSIATGVYESYDTDPLTLAARRVVEAGIVIVAAAGNHGRQQNGDPVYGGVTAPGNAPWVITVGASSHGGTTDRSDDSMAAFSSRGPTAVDTLAKPDIVAPGVGIESLSDPESAFYTTKSAYLLSGTTQTAYLPYLSLSGTSMAAPVVTGTVALMLQANPTLTPNQAKAILQYTAQPYPGYSALTEGTGFLNAYGAVQLATWFGDPSLVSAPPAEWGMRLIWGNTLVSGGRLHADASAWSANVTWGAATAPNGQAVEWGVVPSGDPWNQETGASENIVWGSACGGDDCQGPWTVEGTAGDDDDSVVWGTTVVWGTAIDDDDSVVWGTDCSDPSCEPVMWTQP
jgi:serine protease AprX